MSQDFLRTKKALEPLDCRRTILRGFTLSFPEGRGIDYVEPGFATLKFDPDGEVHGVSTLLCPEDVVKLDRQEGGYDIKLCPLQVYGENEVMEAEVYVSRKPIPLDFPEGCCSKRYRDVLVRGAEENELDATWITKLKALPVYSPTDETLKLRAELPSPSALPSMTIAELATYDGSSDERPFHVSSCGYIFNHRPNFSVYIGRDVTFRNLLHHRGINMDANDDGGKSPFPRLSQLKPEEMEYALQNRDRLMHKGGAPVAVLHEFWQEQDVALDGVYAGNILSQL